MKRQRGFTLVEVLVALLIMAILATMAWRGLDGITRSREIAQGSTERTLLLQSVLAQWEADLEASIENDATDEARVPQLQFDGKSLTLTRRTGDGMQIVVWSLQGESWQRWIGPVSVRPDELQDTWLRAQQLLGNEAGQLRALQGVNQWRLYYYRGNAWTNAQSSADTVIGSEQAVTVDRSTRPRGVRLELVFSEGGGRSGVLRRDFLLPPK